MFASLARREAEAFNIATFPILIVPHPLATLPLEEIHRIGAALVDQVVQALTDERGGPS